MKRQVKVRLSEGVYRRLERWAAEATDGNVSEAARMLLTMVLCGPQSGTTVGPNQGPVVSGALSESNGPQSGTTMGPNQGPSGDQPGTAVVPNQGPDGPQSGTTVVPNQGPSGDQTPSQPNSLSFFSNKKERKERKKKEEGKGIPPTVGNSEAVGNSGEGGERGGAGEREEGGERGLGRLAQHPVVGAYRSAMELWPRREEAFRMAREVRHLNLWKEVLAEWKSRGWNPRNVSGLLDRYRQAVEHQSLVAVSYWELYDLWEKKMGAVQTFPGFILLQAESYGPVESYYDEQGKLAWRISAKFVARVQKGWDYWRDSLFESLEEFDELIEEEEARSSV